MIFACIACLAAMLALLISLVFIKVPPILKNTDWKEYIKDRDSRKDKEFL